MTKIAINGFGRIGRAAFKIAFEKEDIEVVAINDLTDNETLAHLLSFDTVYGRYEKKVEFDRQGLAIDGKKIPVFEEPDPGKLPWKEYDVDVVLECTGIFKTREKVEPHLQSGAKKVIMSAPPKDDIKIFCLGCNEQTYDQGSDLIISNASCTTNCLAPVAKVINDNLGIQKALMTTIHSYTSTQNIVDGPNKDLRRARAAAENIIPSTTGAAIAVTRVIPELEGKFDGMAFRVPTPCVSVVDAVMEVEKPTSVQEVNDCLIKASQNELKGILDCEKKPLVSSDYIANKHSSIVDLEQTMVMGENMIKIVTWYDNEWGYSERLVDMALYVNR